MNEQATGGAGYEMPGNAAERQGAKAATNARNRSVYEVRTMEPRDFKDIIALTKKVYPFVEPYDEEQFESHRRIFPEGQFVVYHRKLQRVIGYAASLIIDFDKYPHSAKWWDHTDWAMFTNHDPVNGRTLYGAEVMVDPDVRGQGVGKLLYQAREDLARRLRLIRIRAGARLRDYHKYAKRMTPEEYTHKVIEGKLTDRTLSFQLKRGFHVIEISKGYLFSDPESLNYAAIIEWINEDVAEPEDYEDWKRSPFYEASQRSSDRADH